MRTSAIYAVDGSHQRHCKVPKSRVTREVAEVGFRLRPTNPTEVGYGPVLDRPEAHFVDDQRASAKQRPCFPIVVGGSARSIVVGDAVVVGSTQQLRLNTDDVIAGA